MKEYRYSVWITNSKAEPYEVWKQCRPRTNDFDASYEIIDYKKWDNGFYI